MTFAATQEAQQRDPNSGKTLLELVEGLLQAVAFTDDDSGTLTLTYTFSEMGSRLAAAGFVKYSREYATGQDPFKLPKRLRQLALARIGLDFDDVASYPTAATAMLETGVQISRAFLEDREHIFAMYGRYFFDGDVHPPAKRRGWIKELFNALDNNGSMGAWRRRHTNLLRASHTP